MKREAEKAVPGGQSRMYLTLGCAGFVDFVQDLRKISSTCTGRGSTGIKASGGYGLEQGFLQQNQYMEKTRE